MADLAEAGFCVRLTPLVAGRVLGRLGPAAPASANSAAVTAARWLPAPPAPRETGMDVDRPGRPVSPSPRGRGLG